MQKEGKGDSGPLSVSPTVEGKGLGWGWPIQPQSPTHGPQRTL